MVLPPVSWFICLPTYVQGPFAKYMASESSYATPVSTKSLIKKGYLLLVLS